MPLGKSLGNLLGDYFGDEMVTLNQEDSPANVAKIDSSTLVTKIPLQLIQLSPYQTRREFDEGKIKVLANSIQQNGLLHPIVVLKRKDSEEFTLLAGERRVRACRLNKMKDVWAIVKEEEALENAQQAMIAAIENLQREDLGPIELANTFKMLMTTQSKDEEGIAEILGNSTQYIKNYLRLLTLHKDVQGALQKRLIGEGQARYLVGLSEEEQVMLLSEIISKQLTVREIQARIRKLKMLTKRKPIATSHHSLPKEVVSKVQKIAELFPNSQLKCTGNPEQGKITISWKTDKKK